jgi:fido (protein-threonine AMPylation protein)
VNGKCEAAGPEVEFEPGSRGRVLRNLLGIGRVRDMHAAESQALELAQVDAVAEVHAELILVHPFRDGNGRLARILALLMALQAGLPPLDFSPMTGRGKRAYIAGIHAAMNRNYAPLTKTIARVIERSKRRAASSGQ